MTTTLNSEIADLSASVENLIFETSLVCLKPSKRLDKLSNYLGLESSTSLSVQVSEEGLFSWMNNKFIQLGQKIRKVVDKIKAKLFKTEKSADEASKLLDKNPNASLPISKAKAIAIVAACVTAAAGATYALTKAFGNGSAEANKKYREDAANKLKSLFSKSNDSGENISGAEAKGFCKKIKEAAVSFGASVSKFAAKIFGLAKSPKGEHTENNDPHTKSIIVKKLKDLGGWILWLVRTCWRSFLHLPAILKRGYITDTEAATIFGDVRRAANNPKK